MSAQAPALVIVDDVELNRAIFYEMFRERFDVLEAGGGPEAIEQIERNRDRIALVLLDLNLPEMDGFQVLREMRERGFLPGLPVMLIACGLSSEKAAAAMSLGVVDFIDRPFNVEIIKSRVLRLLEYERSRSSVEDLVEARTRETRRTSRFAIEALSTIVEFRSGETALHTRRIGLIARLLCQALAKHYPEYVLTEAMIEDIVCASALHDVGMVAVPESILNKPGRLSEEEFEIMKRHTVFGAQVLERISSEGSERFYSYCRDICLCHHERYDGKGYPHGIAGDAIPIWAQVVSLADVYDVLTSERVYKPPFTHKQALHMIEDGDCGAFNPKLLALLSLIESGLLNALDELNGEDEYHALGGMADEALSGRLSPRTLNLIEHEREQYKAFASLSGEVLIDYDCHSEVLTFSERYLDHFEGDLVVREALSSEQLARLIYPQDREALMSAIGDVTAASPTVRLDLRILTKRGWYEWYEMVLRTLWSGEAPSQCIRALGKLTNIDQTVRETSRLREQATRDVLTGLLNRVETERSIKQRILENPDGHGALLYVDIDDFKGFNDSHGHAFGDEVLRLIGQAVHGNIRESDIAGRIGGDEFVVYLDRVRSDEGVVGNVERLIAVMRQGFSIRSESASVSISVGISRYPQDGARYETLLEKADQAMYVAKYGGKGAFAFYAAGQSAKK